MLVPYDPAVEMKPVPGGRYWEWLDAAATSGRWVNADGESLDPQDVEDKIQREIDALQKKLDAAHSATVEVRAQIEKPAPPAEAPAK